MTALEDSATERAVPPSGAGTGRQLTVGAAAVLAVIIAAAAQRTSLGATDDYLHRLVARGDAGVAVLLALAGWAVRRGRAGAQGATGTGLVRRVAALVVVYWVGLAVALVVGRPAYGPRQLVGVLATLPPWRQTTVPGYGQSWVLSAITLFVLLEALVTWVATRRSSTGARDADRAAVWVVLTLVGAASRFALIAAGHPLADGPLARLPGNLDLLALGALAATRPRLFRRMGARLGAPLVVAGVAVAGALPIAPRALTGGTAAEIARHLLVVVVAAGALMIASGDAAAPARSWWRYTAAAGLGAFVVYQAAVELVVRQYVERRQEAALGTVIDGAWLAPLVWVVLIAAALGMLISAAADAGCRHRGDWPPAARLAVVVAGGFLVRVVALLTVAPPKPDGGDPLFYHTTANLLAQGRGFIEPLHWIAYGQAIPSALHGPGYPVFLSAFSRLGGTTIFDHRMASILAGTGVVLLAGLIARRVAGPRAMLIAAVLAALYPNLWIIDGVLFPEGVFIAVTGLAILAAYRFADSRSGWAAAALGVFVGLSAMVRGEGLFLTVLLIVPLIAWRRELPWRRRIALLAIAAAGTLGAIAPWTIRNATRFDSFVTLSTNGDELNVYANCADTYSGKYLGFWLFDCQERLREEHGEAPGDEAQRARYWRNVGWDYAKAHARELPKVIAARVGRQWELFRPLQNVEFAPIEGRNKNAALAGLLSYYALIPFAAVGTLRLRRRKVVLLPLLAQFVSVTVTAAYAYGTVRFRAPAELALVVLAAAGLVVPLRRLGAWWRPLAEPVPLHDADAFVLGGRPAAERRLRAGGLVGLAAVGAVLLAPLRGLLHTPGAPMEEGFMLTFPERVLKGAVPNVDFLHLYGPGSLDVLAAVYRLFGVRLGVERMFGFGQHAALVFGLYVLLRPWGRLLAAIGAGLAVTLIVTPIGLDALAWPGALALGVWSLVAALRAVAPEPTHRRRWTVVSGLLAGLCLTYRPDLVIALLLAHASIWWRRRDALVPLAAGVLSGLVPLWVQLARAGIGPSVRGMILDPVFKLRAGRTLPRPPSWDHLDGALQVIAEKFPPWWGLPSLSASEQLWVWFWVVPALAVGLVIVAVAATRWSRGSASIAGGARQGSDPAATVLLAGSLFSLGIVQQAFQRPDSAHFAWVTCISLALAPAAAAELCGRWRPNWRPARRSLTVGAGLLAVYLTVMPFFSLRIYLLHVRQSIGSLPPGLLVERGPRRFYLGDVPPWMATKEIIADLSAEAKPGERLLVGPVDLRQTVYSDAIFYYLFPELTPATYYIEMDPGMANAPDSGLAEEVASADWLILTRFWAGWIEPNDSIVFGPDEPNQVVQRDFCLVGSYQHDLARLYHRCPGGGAPGPYDGPYDPAYDPAVEVRVPVPRRPDGTCTPTCAD